MNNKELREIKAETFSSCQSLKSVSGGANITSIGSGAFRNCRSLTEFTMPQRLRILNEEAFKGCSSLVTVMFHETVDTNGHKTAATIHQAAFSGCDALKTVYYYYSGEEEKSLLTVDERGNAAFLGANMIFTYKAAK